MARIRRRRRKYTWLPQIGFQGADPQDDAIILPVSIPLTPLNGTLSDVNIFPLLPDAPNDTPATVGDHLDDFIGSEYFLKRIVGRFFFTANFIYLYSATPQARHLALGLGFFVARADGNTQGGTNPIGAAALAERKDNYGPLNLQTTREPWIWRRTWVVSPIQVSATTSGVRVYNTDVAGLYPQNNLQGSVAEGSMIDARTARRIGNDDRLWCAVQAQCLEANGSPGSATYDWVSDGFLDIRCLGALRRARGRSAF